MMTGALTALLAACADDARIVEATYLVDSAHRGVDDRHWTLSVFASPDQSLKCHVTYLADRVELKVVNDPPIMVTQRTGFNDELSELPLVLTEDLDGRTLVSGNREVTIT